MVTVNPIRIVPSPFGTEWIEPLPKERVPGKSTRLLLVDDDPVFCRSMQRTAEKNGIKLKVCQNLGEVLKLPKEEPFDAAVLDYQFGDLTALQVGHFLAEETPIIITSGFPRSDVHLADWPFDVRDFISKSKGNLAILKRALGIGSGNETVSVVELEPSTNVNISLVLAYVAAAIAVLIALSFLTTGRQTQKELLWDAAPFIGNHAMNSTKIIGGSRGQKRS